MGPMRQLPVLVLVTLLAGCHSPKPSRPLVERIGLAHGADLFQRQDGMAGDIHLAFTDGTAFDAHFTCDLKTGRARMQLADESILVFDGRDAWVHPSTAPVKDARHHLLFWPFMITLPLRLGTLDAQVLESGPTPLGADYDALALTCGPGTGDRAGDRYLICADRQSHLVKAIACILARGRPPEEASRDAFAITLYNYGQREGMLLAQDWKIWKYSAAEGLHGLPIGEARVYNIEFVRPRPQLFTPPAGAQKR
jgi:hypothetical protein